MGSKSVVGDIRNVGIPLAITKPNQYLKAILVGLCTMLIICGITCVLTINQQYQTVVLSVIIILLLIFFSNRLDVLHIWLNERKWKDEIPVIVIGFSNKVLILNGEDVLQEIETDEIEIKRLTVEESQDYYSYTSVVHAKKDGKLVTKLYVDGLNDYEGCILNANLDRVDEDIEVIYDDNEDNDDNGQANV